MYNIKTLIEIVNLPISYLDIAMELLNSKKTRYKVLKTLYQYKRSYVVINNTIKKDINNYVKISGSTIELIEFDLALKNILQTQLT